MNGNIVIGVDIGGSHVASAAVDLDTLEILEGTTFSNKIDNLNLKKYLPKKVMHLLL